ncbi:hypothetical protein BK816_05605 [Boudabousia tangfeifanii]|uniref:Uncharacterized protein n=1 Tax=Boudabousia tangfeifanii TaxID=1912795 RepID=A0A1D9MKL3_9ACTO|nr:hypothetical protein [Boudabousia tangfeifanii]AOZ72835.1 hypothetical protein BK816_05605 [Boudabousia tangfeifanii]
MSDRDFEKEFEQLMGAAAPELEAELGAELAGEGTLGSSTSADPKDRTDSSNSQEEILLSEDGIPMFAADPNAQVEEIRPIEDGSRRVGLLLTEVANWKALDHLLRAEEIKGRALGIPTGAGVWVDITSVEDELDALLGSNRPLAPELEEAAKALSKVLGRTVVALQSWLTLTADEEGYVAGQIAAKRYTRGGEGETISGGLVIAGMDPAVEDILLGRTDPLTHQHRGPVRYIAKSWKDFPKSLFNRGQNQE